MLRGRAAVQRSPDIVHHPFVQWVVELPHTASAPSSHHSCDERHPPLRSSQLRSAWVEGAAARTRVAR